MDHLLGLRCHPLQYVCSPFEVEGERELIGEVVVEMVGEVMVEMVREVVVHLSQHCLLRYPPKTYTSSSIHPDTYTSLPYPVSSELASIIVDIILSSHTVSSLTLSSISEIIVDLVFEFGALPTRRPHAPLIRRVLYP